jgi:hypothetical protein
VGGGLRFRLSADPPFGSPFSHPGSASALISHAQGGITLGPEQGELGADFTNLGIEVAKLCAVALHWYNLLTSSFSPAPILLRKRRYLKLCADFISLTKGITHA